MKRVWFSGLTTKMKTRKKPYWENGCDHPEDSYVGSFEYYFSAAAPTLYDVYAYHGKHIASSTAICMRYGHEVHEYEAYGCLSFLPKGDLGSAIWNLLLKNGKITWTKTKKEN